VENLIELLRQHGIQPTPQRLAVAKFVLFTDRHPTAEEILSKVQPGCPTLSKATVYNTLNLMAERGLLKIQNLREGAVVFDANTGRHHHFIDNQTGKIYDIPQEALDIHSHEGLADFEITDYQVTLRGRLKKRSR
jgi:Fe2+ or Zn2+ uptake regulation protein